MASGNFGHRPRGHKTRQQHKHVFWQKPERRKQKNAGSEPEIISCPRSANGTFEILSRLRRGSMEFLQVALVWNGVSETHFVPNSPKTYQNTCQFKVKSKGSGMKIIVRATLEGMRDRVKYDCVIERKFKE